MQFAHQTTGGNEMPIKRGRGRPPKNPMLADAMGVPAAIGGA
jgi:hypothetical protein